MKTLQKQLNNDYGDGNSKKYLKNVIGRNNFYCKVREGYDCSEGMCQIKDGYKCVYNLDSDEDLFIGKDLCDYIKQREVGKLWHQTLMNFDYFFYIKFLFGKRKTLIVDEAHNIPKKMLEYVSLTILEEDVKKIPTYRNINLYIKWITEKAIPEINNKLEEINKELLILANEENLDGVIHEKERIANLLKRIEVFLKDCENFSDEWVFELNEEKSKIKFLPTTIKRFLQEMLWNFADNIVLMSGSILDVQMFCDECGFIEKYKNGLVDVIDIPSTFPLKNRPICYYPVDKITYKKKNNKGTCKQTFDRFAEVCCDIIKKHDSEKGIIHCHTYENKDLLYNAFPDHIKDRIILQTEDYRESSLEKWKISKDKVFLSVNMSEGINLKDDLCRWQICLKLPFLNLKDPRVKKRISRGEKRWYDLEVLTQIIQMYGRAVRSENDYAVFYIIDNGFMQLYDSYYINEEYLMIQPLLRVIPKYFSDAFRRINKNDFKRLTKLVPTLP